MPGVFHSFLTGHPFLFGGHMKQPKGTWEKVRQQAYIRDRKANARCWICKGEIDYCASSAAHTGTYSPDAWEPDHYLPKDKYPEYANDISNLRPSHASCNRARRDREITESPIGNQSRDWG